MKVSIIGTNGLLATEIGLFCNKNNFLVETFGRRKPEFYDYNDFNEVNLSVNDIDYTKIVNSDVIIYAAGAGVQSVLNDSWQSVYNLNTFIPINICKKLNDLGFKGNLVTFGSCFEIGNNSESILFTENEVANSVLDVPNDYCVSKRLLTKFITSNKASYNHYHLFLPTIYGEREAPHRLIPYAIASIKNEEPMQFTSGKQIRQYLYAGDIPKILFDLVKVQHGGLYNLSGIETFSVREIVEKIYKYYKLDTSEDLFGKAERSDVGMLNLQLNDNLLKSVLPEIHYTSFDESLKFYDEAIK